MSLRKKQSVKRLKAALNKNYESKANTIQAGPLGSNQIYAAGQVYNASLDGVTEVVNIGRPAAAQYVARRGGGSTVVASGGGSGSAGGATGDYLRLDGSTIMLGDLNMGSSDIVNVGTVDGVDISAHVANANAHHDQVHSITGDDHTITSAKFGLVGATATNTIGILTPSAAPGAAEAILKSTSSGGLTLPTFTATTSVTTPVIATASGNLEIESATRAVSITGNNAQYILQNATPTAYGALRITPWSQTLTFFANNEYGGTGDPTLTSIFAVDPGAYNTGAGQFRYHGNGQAWEFWDAGTSTGIGETATMTRVASLSKSAIWLSPRGTNSDFRVNVSGNVLVGTAIDSGYKLDISGRARASTSLTTPLITTATNDDLLIDPAGNGLVQFPIAQTVGAVGFDSSFPITGWQINEVAGITGKSALTIGNIQADELAVRIFVADETRVDRGDEYWTKSYGIVAEDFVLPTTLESTVDITFEDSPALTGAIFSNNDWLLIRRLEIDAGLTLFNAWGQVSSYTDNGDGTQTWTFTLKQGPTEASEDTRTIAKGSLAIDFGASGAALIHLSVIDDAGAPYIKMRRWSGANPYSPSNYTTYVQIGNLNNITNTYVTPNGDGLYIRSTAGEDKFIIADDNGLQLRGTDLTLYNSGTQTVNIDSAGTDIWIGNGSSDKLISFDGSELALRSNDTDVITFDTSGNSFFSGVMTIGASGEIRQGTGTLGSNYTGLRIWRDTNIGRIAGYNNNTLQWYADTDGKLYAGAGATWLDVDGVNILTDTTTTHASQSNAKAITFERDNGTLVGRLTSYYISGTTTYGLDLYARSPNQEATFATFGSEQAGTTYAGGSAGAPRVVAYNASGGGDELRLYSSGTIKLFNTASASADVTLSSGTLSTGVLSVAGNITVSGTVDGVDIAAFKTAYDSHTHAYLPLAGGTLTGTLNSRDVIPTADDSFDLGSDTNRFAELHVVNLHVDTVVGTPDYSHTHDAGDITGTLDDARLPGTQSGKTFTSSVHIDADASTVGTYNYIRWKTDNTANKRWDLIAYAQDDATAAQRNDMLWTYYDGSSTHDVLSVDSGTRVVDFAQTPTVGGTPLFSGYLKDDGTVTGATSQAQVFTNGVTLGAGGAATPSLTFGDAGYGIYKSGFGDIGIAIDGELFAWFDNGKRFNVGGSGNGVSNVTGFHNNSTGMAVTPVLQNATTSQQQMLQVQGYFEPQAAVGTLYALLNLTSVQNSSYDVTTINNVFSRFDLRTGYSGAITSVHNYYSSNAVKSGTGTIANLYGFRTANLTQGSQNYGFFGELSEAANRYNLYMAGTAYNYLNGDTGIGTVPSGAYKLEVNGDGYFADDLDIDGRLTVNDRSTFNAPTIIGKPQSIPVDSSNMLFVNSAPDGNGGLFGVGSSSWSNTGFFAFNAYQVSPRPNNGSPTATGNMKYFGPHYQGLTRAMLFLWDANAGQLEYNYSAPGLNDGDDITWSRMMYSSPTGHAWYYNGDRVASIANASFRLTSSSTFPGFSSVAHGATASIWYLDRTLGTESVQTAVTGSNALGIIQFRGHNGSTLANGANIAVYSAENFSVSGNGTTLRFATAANGSTSLVERMRISEIGNILIGTSTDSGYKLDVNGTARATTSLTTPLLTNTNQLTINAGATSVRLGLDGDYPVQIDDTGLFINAGVPDGSAALMVKSATVSDVTAKFQRIENQTARIWRVADENDQDLIVLDDVGNLESGNPGFVSGLTGWQITPAGNAEFNNGVFRGELHSSIFVADEFHATSGTMVFATAGRLKNAATVAAGQPVILDMEDPAVGHAQIFAPGDRLRSKAMGSISVSGTAHLFLPLPGLVDHSIPDPSGNDGVGIHVIDIWMQVVSVSDEGTHFRYTCTLLSGSDGVLNPGTGVIRWGTAGEGLILATSDLNYAPYLSVFTSGAAPWAGDITPHARFGRISGIGVLSGVHEWGFVAGSDLSDNTAPYVVASDGGVELYKVALTMTDGINPTVRMMPSGDVKFGRDVDVERDTGFHFDPATGNVTIGNIDGQYIRWNQDSGTLAFKGAIVAGGEPPSVDWNDIINRPSNQEIINSYTTWNQITQKPDEINYVGARSIYALTLPTFTNVTKTSFVIPAGGVVKFRGGTYANKTLGSKGIFSTGSPVYVYIKGASSSSTSIFDTTNPSILGPDDVLIGMAQGGTETMSWTPVWGRTFIGDSVISTGSIIADKIATGAVIAGKIAANAVTADKIAANAITAGKIAADAVTADKISGNELSAIKTNTGSLTVTGKMKFPAVSSVSDIGYIGFFGASGSENGWIGFKYSTGPIPEATDGMIFWNNQSTKFRFIGASSSEFDHNIIANGVLLTSDERLKTDIQPIATALDTIDALQPVTFRRKNGDDRVLPGFIAQQVQEVLPELVHDDGEYLSIDEIGIIPLLVAAIKELRKQLCER